MRKPHVSALALALGVAAMAACASDKISNPQDGSALLPTLPTASATLNCHYTPDGEITMAVGAIQTFAANNQTDCNGAYGVIGNGIPGALGFLDPNNPNVCQLTQKALTSVKVKRCTTGSGVLMIYTNSSKTTLIQTIGIDRFL